MADPQAKDPVLRQSTRLLAVGINETQASYDILRWETDVFSSYGLKISDVIAASPALGETILAFYGISTFGELTSPNCRSASAAAPAGTLNNVDSSVAVV